MGLRALGRKGNATFFDAQSYINNADTNRDHEISKRELFLHLKKIMNRYSN